MDNCQTRPFVHSKRLFSRQIIIQNCASGTQAGSLTAGFPAQESKGIGCGCHVVHQPAQRPARHLGTQILNAPSESGLMEPSLDRPRPAVGGA